MARQDRKQREFQRRESEILDAALGLCSTPEFESITMARISEEAEVGKGTLYMHFTSKDELLFRIYLRFYRGLLDELRGQLIDGEPLDQLRHIIDHGLNYHLNHREYRYVVEYCDRVDFRERAEPGWRDDFLTLDRAFEEWGSPLLQSGMDAGAIAPRPVNELMFGLHACFKGAISMLWAGASWCPHGSNPEQIIRAATDFMVAGLVGDHNGPPVRERTPETLRNGSKTT